MPPTNDVLLKQPRPRRPRSTRRSIQKQQSRAEILNAAVRVIAEFGFRESSIDLIADAANISSAAVYWHFGNREGLLLALAHYVYEAYAAVIAHNQEAYVEHPEAYIRSTLSGLLQMVVEQEQLIRMQVALSTDGWYVPTLREKYYNYTTIASGPLEKAIQDGIDRGVFRPVNPLTWVLFVFGTMKGVFIQSGMRPDLRTHLLQAGHDAALSLLGLEPACADYPSPR